MHKTRRDQRPRPADRPNVTSCFASHQASELLGNEGIALLAKAAKKVGMAQAPATFATARRCTSVSMARS
jgi:hypothetical protein